jgi:HK97 family phage major capsid protein
MSDLQTRKFSLGETCRSILAKAESEHRELTSSEQRDFDGITAKITSISETEKRVVQLGEMRARINEPIVTRPIQANPGELTYGRQDANPNEVRAYLPTEAISAAPYCGAGLGAYVRGIVTGNWTGAEDLRALAEGSTPGSFLVPTPLANYHIDLLRNQTQVIRAGAVTIPMQAQTLKIARQTGDVTSAWKAENAGITFSDSNFDVVTFTAQTLVAGSKLSIEIVEDAPNIDAIVGASITKSLALQLDYAALYGSGTANQPKGIRNQTGVTVSDMGTNGLALTDYSKFSSAIATLQGANVNGPFGAIYSARTAGELDNLQDTLHQPLRQPDSVAAMRKYVSNQVPNNLVKGTSSLASDAFVGQFDQCLIGMRTGMTLEISRVAADSTGSAFSNLQWWVRAYLRCDVQLSHPAAFVVLNGIL